MVAIQTNLAGVVGKIRLGAGSVGSRGHIDCGDDLGAGINAVAKFARSCGHMIDVEIAAGNYELQTPFDISLVPLNIEASPGMRCLTKRQSVGDAIGFGRIAANESRFKGGVFLYDKHVAGQVGIKVAPVDTLSGGSPVYGLIDNVHVVDGQHVFNDNTAAAWDETSTTTKDATAMVAVDALQSHAGQIRDNQILPNRGVIGIRATNGKSNQIEGNRVRAGTILYLSAIPDQFRRAGYVGIDMNAETLLSVARCKVTDMGEAVDTARRATQALRIRFPNVAKGTYEYGHLKVNNCEFEDVLSLGPTVLIQGCRWGQYARNVHCFNGIATADGSGFLALVDSIGDGSGVNHIIQPFEVQACEFHNPGTAGAAAIYMRSVKNFVCQASVFHEMQSSQAVLVDSSVAGYDVLGVAFQACKAVWPTTQPTERNFMRRIGSTAPAADLYLNVLCETGAPSEAVDALYDSGSTAFTGKNCVNGMVVPSTGAVLGTDVGVSPVKFGV